MKYTQIEIESPTNKVEVWWIPVPAGKAKVGEKIVHDGEEWIIIQVCATLDENKIPISSRMATQFSRISTTSSHMEI